MERAQGFAEQGGQIVETSGLPSQTFVQVSYPYAAITVFFAGTTVLAVLFSDNQKPSATPQSNPFTANVYGHWFFYAANGRYDVMMDSPDMASGPWTMGDILLYDPADAGVTPPVADQTPWTQDIDGGGFSLSNVNIIDVTGGYEINGQAVALWLLGSGDSAYYTAGNVGIGNNDPKYALDVTGSVNVSGAFLVNGVAIGTGGGGNFWQAGPSGSILYGGGPVAVASLSLSGNPLAPVINANGAFVGAGVNVGTFGISAASATITGQGLPANSTVLSIYGTGGTVADVQVNGSILISGQMVAQTYAVQVGTQGFFGVVGPANFTTADGQTATIRQGLIVSLTGGGSGGGAWVSGPNNSIYYSAGNVGIGGAPTTGANAALQVTGNINVTGQYLVNGVAIGTGGGGNFWQAGAAGAIFYTGGNVGVGTNNPPAGDLFSVNGAMSAASFALFANPTVPVINSNGAFVGSGVDVSGLPPVSGPSGGVRCIDLQANSVSVLGPIEGIQTTGNEGALLALGAVVSADASSATTGGAPANGGYFVQPLNQSPILCINNLGQFVGPGINVGSQGIQAAYVQCGTNTNTTALSVEGDIQCSFSIEVTGQVIGNAYAIQSTGHFGVASAQFASFDGFTVTVEQGLVVGVASGGGGGSANLSVASLTATGGVSAGSMNVGGGGITVNGGSIQVAGGAGEVLSTYFGITGQGFGTSGSFSTLTGTIVVQSGLVMQIQGGGPGAINTPSLTAGTVTASQFNVQGGNPGVSANIAWYGASTSGGPANVLHELVVENGIVVLLN